MIIQLLWFFSIISSEFSLLSITFLRIVHEGFYNAGKYIIIILLKYLLKILIQTCLL